MRRRVPLLRVNGEQIITIPEEYELNTDEVVIYRRGDALVIEPRKGSDQSPPAEDPFATFSEWDGEADMRAYKDL